MEEKFNKDIKTEFNYGFDVEEDGVYTITAKASCRPGWRNQWWLKIKGVLEDIIDLHLDDDDLRVEIDDILFRKPKGRKGLYNSPAAFSGTKTLGKTKTVIWIIRLGRGEHTLHFIPERAPYLYSVQIEPLNNRDRFLSYLSIRAEEENYYSWYTLVSVNQKLDSFLLSAKADKKETETDDDDLRIVIDGEIQRNKESRHLTSYFCGLSLKGRAITLNKRLNLIEGTHYFEVFADKQPTLLGLGVIFEKASTSIPTDPTKSKEIFNQKYVLKDSAIADYSSLSEEEIEAFLGKHGESHPNHICHKVIGERKISFWIKKFTFETGLNPKIIITKLQAEKGLITGDTSINPTQDQLDWALGAGSLDTGNVGQYGGLLTQLREAPRLFKNYLASQDKSPYIHSNVDGQPLTVVNNATLALYTYTPHLAGANLFYRVYSQFFGNNDLGGEI